MTSWIFCWDPNPTNCNCRQRLDGGLDGTQRVCDGAGCEALRCHTRQERPVTTQWTEAAILDLKRRRFEAALDKVLEDIGRLKQRFSTVARHDEVTVEKAKTGPNASAVRVSRRRQRQYDEADCAPATSTGTSRRSCVPTGGSRISRRHSEA